jgi:hypothetical protein
MDKHIHEYIRVQDISYMYPYAFECACGDIRQTPDPEPPMTATIDEIVLDPSPNVLS